MLAFALMAPGGAQGEARLSGEAPHSGWDALDEELAREAYAEADRWVLRAEVPDSPLPQKMSHVSAVHVTLRRDGQMISQATAVVDESAPGRDPADEAPDAVRLVDVMIPLRQAVAEALRGVVGRLESPTDLPEVAEELLLDVQIARRPERVRIEGLGELPGHVRPGVHGLALRHGEEWAWVFPGNAIATNRGLQSQVNRLLGELGLPLDQLALVGTEGGPALYRFEVIHLVRPRSHETVKRLHRGGELLPARPLGRASLRELGERLADHLIGRQRSDGRFAGTYEPTANRYRPVTAGAFESAQAAFALARLSRLEGLASERREAAAEAARRAVERLLAPADDGEPSAVGDELGPTAMALLAALEAPAVADRDRAAERLGRALSGMQQAGGLFNARVGGAAGARLDVRPAPLSMQALAAAAQVRLYDRSRDPEALDAASRALAAVWEEIGDEEERFLAALPYLAHAETALARLGRPSDRLDDMVRRTERLWRRQVTGWDDGAGDAATSPDTIGGFRLGESAGDEPTAHSARALAAQAMVLGAEGLIGPDDHPRWLVGCGLGGRFLAQLTVGPSNVYYVRQPRDALGGVRRSFWNNQQALGDTAAGLLAVAELLHALERLDE